MTFSPEKRQDVIAAFKRFEENRNTNPLVAAVSKAAGVELTSKQFRDVVKAAELLSAGVPDGNGGNNPIRTAPDYFDRVAQAFAEKVESVL